MIAHYRFRQMTTEDLPMIGRWLAEPHVMKWWGNSEEQFALLAGDLNEPAMRQFIVDHDETPFAYIQTYDLSAWPQPVFADQPRGTLGIDQFIGKPDMIDRGHGSAFISAFVENIIGDAPRVITDPHPDNVRAIRAYRRAGFREDRLIETADGQALLMVCEK